MFTRTNSLEPGLSVLWSAYNPPNPVWDFYGRYVLFQSWSVEPSPQLTSFIVETRVRCLSRQLCLTPSLSGWLMPSVSTMLMESVSLLPPPLPPFNLSLFPPLCLTQWSGVNSSLWQWLCLTTWMSAYRYVTMRALLCLKANPQISNLDKNSQSFESHTLMKSAQHFSTSGAVPALHVTTHSRSSKIIKCYVTNHLLLNMIFLFHPSPYLITELCCLSWVCKYLIGSSF